MSFFSEIPKYLKKENTWRFYLYRGLLICKRTANLIFQVLPDLIVSYEKMLLAKAECLTGKYHVIHERNVNASDCECQCKVRKAICDTIVDVARGAGNQ